MTATGRRVIILSEKNYSLGMKDDMKGSIGMIKRKQEVGAEPQKIISLIINILFNFQFYFVSIILKCIILSILQATSVCW